MDLFMTWADAFRISLMGVTGGVIQFLPKLILIIVLFFIGWAFAKIVSSAIQALSKKTRFENLFEQAGITDSLSKSGIRFSVGKLVGEIVRWSLVVIFLVPTLESLGLSETTALLKAGVVEYIPKVVLAVIVMIIAAVVAKGMQMATTTAARSVNIRAATTLGVFVKYIIWAFAIMIALTELGIGEQIIYTILIGFIGMIAVGGAIAIGLGGKDIAHDALAHLKEEIRPRQ